MSRRLASLIPRFSRPSISLTRATGSNSQSTPIIAFQDRGFQEEYFKTDLAYHHSRHEWKAGVEGDFAQLREAFSDVITDPTQFDPGTPLTFTFPGAIPSEGR